MDTTMVWTLLLNTPLAPLAGAVNVTFTPETGLLEGSTMLTPRDAKAVWITALWGVVPGTAAIVFAAPAVLVREKLAGAKSETFATTVYDPASAFAAKAADATPELLVISAMLDCELGKVPLAPLAGAVKVTLAPATGFPLTSVTVTPKGVPKAVLIAVLWGLAPEFTLIEAGGKTPETTGAAMAIPPFALGLPANTWTLGVAELKSICSSASPPVVGIGWSPFRMTMTNSSGSPVGSRLLV